MTGKRWHLKNAEMPKDLVEFLKKSRGISDDPTAKLSDPFLFPEMEKAVARIEKAMQKKETIAIFGDYDADGVTATAQLVRFFRRHGVEPVVYLPDRLKEGYGMRRKSIDELKAKNVSLIITVDTGISANDEILHASGLGIDTIVTDHHRAQHGRPPAFAVIHPTVPRKFPNPHLCGAGVAFMFVRALEHGIPWQGIEEDIVLATIGTIGDLVPLTGENRTLVIHGLHMIAKLREGPLHDLIESVTNGKQITSSDIAFRIVPRINAAGRMQHPVLALDALLEGGEAIEVLHRLNGERQLAIEEALVLLRPDIDVAEPFILGISPHITSGIVGLAAGRLTEEYGRPSLIASVQGEHCVASLRSIESIDVMSCLEHPRVRPFLLAFGGHAQAAGCTFLASKRAPLQAALSQSIRDLGFSDEALLPVIAIDHELSPDSAHLMLAKKLQSLEPFGAGNEQPVFLMKHLRLESMKTVGADAAHLQLGFGALQGIAFKMGGLTEYLSIGAPLDLACSLSVNSWNGRESLQLMVEDMRTSDHTGTNPPSI